MFLLRLLEKIRAGKVYTIAEMSGNHGGNLNYALEIVRAAAEAGADCLKTQTYTADSITLNCDNSFFQIENGLWAGRTLYDLYGEAHTPFEWQPIIKEECDRLGLDFLSSVFDFSSVDYLEEIGAAAYKIASPELIDIPLIEYAAKTGKPIIISTGLGSLQEIGEAVSACHTVGNDNVILLKCTAEYPAQFQDMNLLTIPDMASRFSVPVGFSDHSLGDTAAISAVTLGAKVVEKHFCITRSHESVDSAFSMEKDEFARMVCHLDEAIQAVGCVEYELSETELQNAKWRRSIFASRDITAGEVFSADNCRSVRPGVGLPPKYYKYLLGRVAARDIPFGNPILKTDLQDAASDA